MTAVAATIPLRVRVQDAWDEVELDLAPETTLQELSSARSATSESARIPTGSS